MNKKTRNPTAERIVEIRTENQRKLLARYNVATGTLEIKQRGRLHRIRLLGIDTRQKIVYTESE